MNNPTEALDAVRNDLQVAMSAAEAILMNTKDDEDRIRAKAVIVALRSAGKNLKEVQPMIVQTSANEEKTT